jgi:hypothetical protein
METSGVYFSCQQHVSFSAKAVVDDASLIALA